MARLRKNIFFVMSAIKSIMTSINLVRILTCCCLLVGVPVCSAGDFPFFGFGFLKAPARTAESTLVRVIIVTTFFGEKNTIEINGRPLAEYSPIIKQSFSSTGIVLDQNGHIMTFLGGYRWLDIQNDSSIGVFKNGQKWEGKLVGIDQRNGVAVIKLVGGKPKKTPVCDECEVKGGATVMAPASARTWQLHQAQVVSIGTEPAAADSGEWIITVDRPFPDIWQPILTPDHRVFGFIAGQDPLGTRNTVYPISQLLASANAVLKKGGDIYAGWLGLFVMDSLPAMGSGVLIQSVEPDSPAQKAGLTPGDLLLKYNGQRIMDSGQYVQLVEGSPIDSRANIEIIRQGNPMTLSALISARKPQANRGMLSFNMPGAFGFAASGKKSAEPPRNHKLLIGVETLLLEPPIGLLVIGVEQKSPAESAGVLVGDIITSIDGQPIKGDVEFLAFLQTHNWGPEVLLQIDRKGNSLNLPVQISSQEKQ
jgi:S1-C subfamily serine protease